MFVPLSAKPRPSKKAKLNKPADDNPAIEPEKTPEPLEPNADDIPDDPPPQDHETFVEQMENDPTGHAVDPPSPAKAADKPPSPVKAADDKTDDVVVTDFGYTTPGNPIALSKHNAKEEAHSLEKGKVKLDLETYAALSASDIHADYLNRLHTSHDLAAGWYTGRMAAFGVTFC